MTKNLSREFQSVKRPGRVVLNGVCAVIVLCAEEVEITGKTRKELMPHWVLLILLTIHPFNFYGNKSSYNSTRGVPVREKDDVKVLYPTRRKYESSWTQIKALLNIYARKI